MNKNIFRAALISALFATTGCDTISEKFVDAKETVLPGERISVLQLQKELTPDPTLAGVPATLPDVWQNKFWPQLGGYPNHAMGHLTLGAKIREVWSSSIEGGDRRTPLTSVPIVAEETVFALDTDGDVTAFHLANGKKKWQMSVIPAGEEDSGAVGGGIAYSSGKLYVTSGYKYLVSLNPATGKPFWKTTLPSPVRAAPTVMEDRVYVITLDNRLMVYAASDGTPIWNYAGISESTNLLGSAAPAADASIVVLPLSSGQIFGLRPENGQIAWEDNLSAVRRAGALSSISDIKALPVIDQGAVFALSYSGRMVALDPVTGARLWQREIGGAETPWPAGDSLFVVTSEQQLAALARVNGATRWVIQLPRYKDKTKNDAIVWHGPVLAGGRLFVAGNNETLLEISPDDGKTLATHDLSAAPVAAPIVADGTLLVLTANGKITAWR